MPDAGNGRVQFALYITIYADKIGELDRLSDEVESIFGSRLVYSRARFYQAGRDSITIPLGNDELYIIFNIIFAGSDRSLYVHGTYQR